MSSVYWFGCRDFDPERHSIPGKAVLCGPYATREKAKAEKSIYNRASCKSPNPSSNLSFLEV